MTGLTNEQIEHAVEWWARDMRSRVSLVATDSYERDPESAVRVALAESWLDRMRPEVTETQIEAFKQALRERLQELSKNHKRWSLQVDYGPDRILYSALDAAGIHGPVFSLKTSMYLTEDGEVIIARGQVNRSREVIYSPEQV